MSVTPGAARTVADDTRSARRDARLFGKDPPASEARTPAYKQFARVVRVALAVTAVGGVVTVLFLSAVDPDLGWVGRRNERNPLLITLFCLAFVFVASEETFGVNKTAFVLTVSSAVWTVLLADSNKEKEVRKQRAAEHGLDKGLLTVATTVLFLLPAMAIVESVELFGGFNLVRSKIHKWTSDVRWKTMAILSVWSFFTSALVDNFVATVVSLKVLHRLVPDVRDREWRHTLGAIIVISVNAGGAWSPIGNITTTLLWSRDRLGVVDTIGALFLPCVFGGAVPVLGLWLRERYSPSAQECPNDGEPYEPELPERFHVLVLALVCLLLVPLLKMLTGVPPFVWMMFSLGVFWMVTDFMELERVDNTGKEDTPRSSPQDGETTVSEDERDEGEDRGFTDRQSSSFWMEESWWTAADGLNATKEVHKNGVLMALARVHLDSLLFFTGVLLIVAGISAAGILAAVGEAIREEFGLGAVFAGLFGLCSAFVQKVGLVDVSIEMFRDRDEQEDEQLWHLIALVSGLGGSLLTISNIAGVTLMTTEGVPFLWYLRRITPFALLGYAAGIGVFVLQYRLVALL